MARILIRQAHGGATRIISDGALPYFLNQGYVVLETLDDDTDASPLYLSAAESDLRYARISDLGDPESAEGQVLTEAFGSVLADHPSVVAAAEDAVSAAANGLVRVVKGTGAGYPARPVGAALVEYIGPLKPTDWLDDDCWTPTNGVPSGQEII